MIIVMARVRVANWDRFKAAHDEPARLRVRQDRGNLTHRVLNQIDDARDVVFLDTWSSPQDSDSFYHSDEFQKDLADMRADLVELVKLESTDVSTIERGKGIL